MLMNIPDIVSSSAIAEGYIEEPITRKSIVSKQIFPTASTSSTGYNFVNNSAIDESTVHPSASSKSTTSFSEEGNVARLNENGMIFKHCSNLTVNVYNK
ncbi:hypothetical protein NQ315_017366 [Exocentrus adspersus]|uniref:Uncharacterized protein n=1 Tax=Exocentrus adspersus TaxID=1586481 RepID=A0AAV8VKQ6_9CUCU|nr:hypothetical protein NQ315_017366 [Exocentrus adspersus]